ncbi:phosphatase PAP2 family protein [Arenibaculum pallidiluteum]|uniref:phosphatase PAP2 family protein n=1 Tax=Arenibaculum pallidiluteum TaxID=2812559 RepID=UPI001A973178|nr:phosphatase PAP2 family protein [Arenibaculum pallidiluteum]
MTALRRGVAGTAIDAVMRLDAATRVSCLDRAGALGPLIALGRYGIKRHVLMPGFAALWLLGRERNRPKLEAAGRLGLVSVVGTALAIDAVKLAMGRERPDAGAGPDSWRRGVRSRSFPSGHAGTVFAAATVAAIMAEDVALGGTAYATAMLLAWSRMLCDRHWLSDVVAGAALGTAVTLGARAALPELDPPAGGEAGGVGRAVPVP